MIAPVYLHDWANGQFDKMKNDFVYEWGDPDSIPQSSFEQFQGIEVLLASYMDEGYDGHAFVLFRKDCKLYEVNAYHCSCYGLENQWEPEETTIDTLVHRMTEGGFGKDYSEENVFANELVSVIEQLRKGM